MSDEQIKAGIMAALEIVSGKKLLELDEDQSLFESYGLESIDFVDFIFETEQRLNCEIVLEELIQSAYNPDLDRYNGISFKSFFEFVKHKSLAK